MVSMWCAMSAAIIILVCGVLWVQQRLFLVCGVLWMQQWLFWCVVSYECSNGYFSVWCAMSAATVILVCGVLWVQQRLCWCVMCYECSNGYVGVWCGMSAATVILVCGVLWVQQRLFWCVMCYECSNGYVGVWCAMSAATVILMCDVLWVQQRLFWCVVCYECSNDYFGVWCAMSAGTVILVCGVLWVQQRLFCTFFLIPKFYSKNDKNSDTCFWNPFNYERAYPFLRQESGTAPRANSPFHHHHHHVHEVLGVFPVPWSSRCSWSLHLFLGRPTFRRPFGLYCSACFGSLCPSSVRVVATFPGTVLFPLLCSVLPFFL